MKKIFSFLLALTPLMVIAQVNINRSKAPQPAPAPKIQIPDPASFTLANGLKVFVVQNTKLPRVNVTLTIDRDPVVEGNKAGMVSLAGELMKRGTKKMSKAQLDEAVDFLGGSLSASSTTVSASSLKKNFPKLMGLMADVVLRPAFSQEELEKIRKQSLTALQAAKDNPTSIASNVVNKLVYGSDHPYGEIETEETLKNITLEDIKSYYAAYWKPNIGYLIFVGDITTAEAKILAETHFNNWKSGEVPKGKFTDPAPPSKTYIAVVDRPASVQSVIRLVAPINLKPGSENAIAASVMNNVLGGSASARLFMNLRERHGFTYGAYSSLSPDKLVGIFNANASVRNEKTDSAIAEFLNEMNRIRTEEVSEDELSRIKNYLSGSFARSLESPSTIASFALDIARYKLPKDYYRNYLTNLANITSNDIQKAANNYIVPDNLHIVIVGNAKEIAKGLEKYGQIRYFDIYGNEKAAPVQKKVDASVTAESIIKKAIEAMGGEAAIGGIKDISLNGTASLMGQEASVTQKAIIPSAYSFEMSVQGMSLQKDLLKNGEYTRVGRAGNRPADEKGKEELDEKASFFTEAYMLKKGGYQFTVKGIEPVEDKDAYVVEVKTPKGRSFTNYYDVVSGLPVKTQSLRESAMGAVTVSAFFRDYKDFNGVKIPTKVINDLGQIKLEVNFTDIKVNAGLKVEDIK